MNLTLTRLEKSWLRSFFSLPQSLRDKPNKSLHLLLGKPLPEEIFETNSVVYKGTTYFVIWLSSPTSCKAGADLSFRDFSQYGEVPVVLIRTSIGK